MGNNQSQPDNRDVRRINGEFYVSDGIVRRAPVHTETATGTNISVGFPVCEPSEYVDAEQLAGCLNEHEALKSQVAELKKALKFYASEWQTNGDGDSETPGLSRSWMEPTEELYNDEGRAARKALAMPLEDRK